MNLEMNTPNIVVDDNYRMLVNRLTRRYANRNAVVCTDAEVIEQERSDARARAIAPDAYRISSVIGENPEMYKSDSGSGARYVTTDDYMTYFSKCHDTFDAINYCSKHAPISEANVDEQAPRVLVNRKRLEQIKNGAPQKKVSVASDKKTASASATAKQAPQTRGQAPKKAEQISGLARFGYAKGRAFTAFAAVAASIAILVGGLIVMVPSDEVETYARNVAEEEIVNLAEVEVQEILQNRE